MVPPIGFVSFAFERSQPHAGYGPLAAYSGFSNHRKKSLDPAIWEL
jgi:hypothetical protein